MAKTPRKPDEVCVSCLQAMDKAMKRAMVVRIWTEVEIKGRPLAVVLAEMSPGTELAEPVR